MAKNRIGEIMGYGLKHSCKWTEVTKLEAGDESVLHKSIPPAYSSNLAKAVEKYYLLTKVAGCGVVGSRTTMRMLELPVPTSEMANGVEVFTYDTKTLRAARVDIDAETASPVKLTSYEAWKVLLLYMPELMKNAEFKETYNEITSFLSVDGNDVVPKSSGAAGFSFRLMCRLSENTYYRISGGGCPDSVSILGPSVDADIQLIRFSYFEGDALEPDQIDEGEMPFTSKKARGLSGSSATPAKEEKDLEEERKNFCGSFKMRELTDYEETLVPALPSDHIVTAKEMLFCNYVKNSTGKRHKLRNFLLRGGAGTGKSRTAKAMAVGLHLPFCILPLNPETEIYDLCGQLIPVTQDEAMTGDEFDYDDILFDAPGAWEKITGVPGEGKEAADVLKLIAGRIGTGGTKYRYVESPLIKALRYGWACEIQEISLPKNSGVLPGINSMMEQDGKIVLPITGVTFDRHPDAVVIATTNITYEGCMPLNQAFVDRMNIIEDMDVIDEKVAKKMVMADTDETDSAMIDEMFSIVGQMRETLKEAGDNSGEVGLRSIIDWVTTTQISGNVYQAAMSTIIPSASTDPDMRAQLVSTHLDVSSFR